MQSSVLFDESHYFKSHTLHDKGQETEFVSGKMFLEAAVVLATL